MKKFKLKRNKGAVAIITASSVAINMLFLPPFLPVEEFYLKKKELECSLDEDKPNLYSSNFSCSIKQNQARNFLAKPDYKTQMQDGMVLKRLKK